MEEVIIQIFFATIIGGLLGSIIGLGGGFIIVPFLTLIVGLPIKMAIPISLLSIVVISLSATSIYAPNGRVNFRAGIILESTMALGAVIGANINLMIDERYLYVMFALLLLYVSYRMYTGTSRIGGGGMLSGSMELALTLSFLGGILSALLGIGGGLINIPILVLIFGLPMETAIGTSLFIISLTSMTSTFIYLIKGALNVMYGSAGVLGAYIGSQLGSRLGLRLKAETLRRLFIIVLIVFSYLMLSKGLGV